MNFYFLEGKRLYKLWIHSKKGPLQGEIALQKKVVPSIQKQSSDTYSCVNNVRCKSCS